MTRKLIVDNFAGGGGASTGIEMATGRSPDIAINHDAVALAMHEVNHPTTQHLCTNVWQVDPDDIKGEIGLGWFSPDCKHFSKAKGGKPVEKGIRDLAWVVVRWAKRRAGGPDVIMLENVEEFSTWGPLGEDGKPCPDRKGETFKQWIRELRRCGYKKIEYRELRACDYGAPTIRKRLFLIARRDGKPIIWPDPTHGDPKKIAAARDAIAKGDKGKDTARVAGLLPWRTAAEIIDWSLPCPSIFATSAEIMVEYGLRAVRPLQPATMARIAKGVQRYVIDAAKPFIVNLTHQGGERTESIDEPVMTVTGAHRGEKAIVTPYLARTAHGEVDRNGKKRGQGTHTLEEPFSTVLASPDHALVAPIMSTYYGEGQGENVRAASLGEPLRTQTTENRHALVTSKLTPLQGDYQCDACGEGNAATWWPTCEWCNHDQGDKIAPFVTGVGGRMAQTEPRSADQPVQTLTAKADSVLVAPHLTKFRANSVGSSMDEPAPTVTANSFIKRPGGAAPIGLVAPHLMTMRNARKPFNGGDEPTHTITSGGARLHLVAAFMAQHNIGKGGEGNPGRDVNEPVSTVMQSGSHQGLVAANLAIHRGTGIGSDVNDPVRTATAGGQHQALVSSFLQKYYGTAEGQAIDDPVHTATAKARFGLVTVIIEGEPYVISDIGMRMLSPRELFRAQGFPESYVINEGIFKIEHDDAAGRWTEDVRRPISKTDQVSKCGNSVSPPMACALVAANCPDLIEMREAAE